MDGRRESRFSSSLLTLGTEQGVGEAPNRPQNPKCLVPKSQNADIAAAAGPEHKAEGRRWPGSQCPEPCRAVPGPDPPLSRSWSATWWGQPRSTAAKVPEAAPGGGEQVEKVFSLEPEEEELHPESLRAHLPSALL